MKRIKIGLIGVGKFGTLHLKTLLALKECILQGVFDINNARSKQAEEEFKVKRYLCLEDLIADSQALIIATPTPTHYELGKLVLENKKHCLIEKPLTLNIKEAEKLLFLSRKNKVVLYAGHIERYNSAFLEIKRIIKRPIFIEIHRLNIFSSRNLEVSVVLDLMIHDIDIVLGLVNSPLKKVEAFGIKVVSPKADIAQARLYFQNDCIANITSSRISDETLRKLRVFTSNMYASIDYRTQEGSIYRKNQNLIAKIPLKVEKEEPLKRELKEFISSCQKNKSTFPIKEALKSLEVCLDIDKKVRRYEKSILGRR